VLREARRVSLALERAASGQQLVEEDRERVDVRARVHATPVPRDLLGAHVVRRPQRTAFLGERRHRRGLAQRLGDSQVDDLEDDATALPTHQDVGRRDVAMNHGVVMGVLDPVADPEEQLEALLHAELLLVAIFRDGDALHVLHDEIRTPVGHGSGIEHAGDRGMIHRGQGLTLGLEAGDDAPGRETRTDELDRRGDSLEARRVHGHSPGALDSSRASQARASRQSSLMVRSETLIASALSFTEAPA
jgi:hypothetical protein